MRTSAKTLVRCVTLSLALTAGCGKEQPPPQPPEPAGAPVAEENPVDKVLAEALAAAGGQAAVDAIESSYTETKGTIPAQGLTMLNKVWTKGEDFYLESDMPGVGKSQTWKVGNQVWAKDPINGLRELKGDEAWQALWSTDPLLLANWRNYFDEAKMGDDAEGVVSVVFIKGDKEVVMSFEKDSYVSHSMSFEQASPMGNMPVTVEFADHREVEGVKIPFRTVTDLKLMKIESEVLKYEVNVEVDPERFKPPTT